MLKLYKQVNDQLHYWETWDKDEKTGIIHWGIVGEQGKDEEIKSGLLSDFRKKIQQMVDKQVANGFAPIEIEDHHTLIIEYAIEGMGTAEDLDKRHRLQAEMDEVLGWVGIGHCDGGSIGSGTMEVCCLVVDFNIAARVIATALNNTEFANYTRIFDENSAAE